MNAKKHLIVIVPVKFYAFKGKKRDKLDEYLKNIIQWRNAFAHVSCTLNAAEGIIFKYYSGSPKGEILDDRVWHTVASLFNGADELLKKWRVL